MPETKQLSDAFHQLGEVGAQLAAALATLKKIEKQVNDHDIQLTSLLELDSPHIFPSDAPEPPLSVWLQCPQTTAVLTLDCGKTPSLKEFLSLWQRELTRVSLAFAVLDAPGWELFRSHRSKNLCIQGLLVRREGRGEVQTRLFFLPPSNE